MNSSNIIENTSVLKALRSLMPSRVLSYGEALQRVELQANRLLELDHLTRGPVPAAIVSELPRISVVHRYDLPVSGSAHWNGRSWVITLNAGEPELRQRFSLMHEAWHVIDHPFQKYRRDMIGRTSEEVAERLADYFAACVLMPKAWVKAAYCSKTQKVEKLAAMFEVSTKAMSVRLAQLGLTEPVQRCERVTGVQRRQHPRSYFRTATATRLRTAGVSP